jgi:PAS domain S-box-containing protein
MTGRLPELGSRRAEEKAPDFPDREVSCRLSCFLFEFAEKKGIEPGALTAGVRYPREHLLDPSRRIDWLSFRMLMQNVGKSLSDAELMELGREAARSRWARPFGLVVRLLWQVRGLFHQRGDRRPGPGNILVTCLQTAPREIEPNHYELGIYMQEGYEPCREFFVAAAGFLTAWPSVLGLSPAIVAMTEVDAGARYEVRMPPAGGLLARLWSAAARRLASRTESSHLQEALEFLQAGYLELQDHVTWRRRVEEALRESEERFRRLTENARDLIDELDTEGRFLYVSPNHLQVTGHDPEELLGTSAFERLADSSERDSAAETFARILTSGRSRSAIFHARHKDGSSLWFEATGNVFTTASGETRIVVVSRDVTEQKRADEERQSLEARLRHSQKLESLGVLAGGIAHDFNNLLTPILGYVEQGLRDLDAGSPVRASLERVKSGALRAAELTNQLLIHAGESHFVMQALDLSGLVREMASLLETATSRGAEVRYDFASDLPVILGDATQVRQVIMNLITNASEAIGNRPGTITVRTGTMCVGREYLSRTLSGMRVQDGIYVYLEVADDGCGMDEKTIERMFDPFFSTKFTGRGLGLSTLLGIVDGHRGAIRVDSAPGRGTTIRVLFPATEGAQDDAAVCRAEHEGRFEGTVLIIEDDPEVRGVTAWMLESGGFSVLTAEDGCQGVDVFRRNADRISLVLVDLSLPRMCGEEVLREIRRIRPHIPALVVSGYGEKHLADRSAGDAMTDFIPKPYERGVLLEKIRQVLG